MVHEKSSPKGAAVLYFSRGGEISGEQRQLLYLLEGLERNRYRPRVLCTREGPFQEELRKLDIPCQVHPFVGWRKVKHLLRRYLDAAYIRAFVRDNHIALVHCSDVWLSSYALQAVRNTTIPSILHVRAPLTIRQIRKFQCHKATRVITISTRVQKRLIQTQCIPESRIVLIHDAVDADVFKPLGPTGFNVLRQQYAVQDKILVGLIGRIEPQKEQFGFIKIARQVLSKTKKVAFFLIGQIKDKSYAGRIERYAKEHGLSNYIHFTDRRDDIAEVLGSLDVLVSLTGGSVRYEAMMCGVPVICAWSRKAEESYNIRHNETGLLISERSTRAVSEALLSLLENENLRRRIGINARHWAYTHLTHRQLVHETQVLYDQLLGNRIL